MESEKIEVGEASITVAALGAMLGVIGLCIIVAANFAQGRLGDISRDTIVSQDADA
jgi:Ca2+/H+ antiporter